MCGHEAADRPGAVRAWSASPPAARRACAPLWSPRASVPGRVRRIPRIGRHRARSSRALPRRQRTAGDDPVGSDARARAAERSGSNRGCSGPGRRRSDTGRAREVGVSLAWRSTASAASPQNAAGVRGRSQRDAGAASGRSMRRSRWERTGGGARATAPWHVDPNGGATRIGRRQPAPSVRRPTAVRTKNPRKRARPARLQPRFSEPPVDVGARRGTKRPINTGAAPIEPLETGRPTD
jgi:hypothetical protein